MTLFDTALNEVKMMLQIQKVPLALSQFDDLPNSAFIRLPTMTGLYGVSAATIWRGVKNGTIPKPRKLSERCTAWQVGSVRAALAAKVGF